MPGNELIDPSYKIYFNISNEAQFIIVEIPNTQLIKTGTAYTPANSTS